MPFFFLCIFKHLFLHALQNLKIIKTYTHAHAHAGCDIDDLDELAGQVACQVLKEQKLLVDDDDDHGTFVFIYFIFFYLIN